MPRTRWQTQLDDLRRDNQSGSAEIAYRALEMVSEAIGDSTPNGPLVYRQWLLRLSRELIAAQPSMGILFRMVNDMLWASHEATSGPDIRQQALDYLQTFQAHALADQDKLIEHACNHLGNSSPIMTFSRSSTVLQVLTCLGHRNRHLHVYCSEGRPMLEGQTLASEMGWAGIEVTMGVDMALFGWLQQVKALIVGVDSLQISGVVNKLGTSPLIQAADRVGVPCLAICTTNKMLPNDYTLGRVNRAGSPEEIMPASNDNLHVLNPYYDTTPLEFFAAVITERGVLDIAQVQELLGQIKTYPGLRGRALA